MSKSLFLYIFVVILVLCTITACTHFRSSAKQPESTVVDPYNHVKAPFMAQVVGLQWLNPLQRKDYPTQWQLLWSMGLVKPNPGDEMVRDKPEKYTKIQSISSVAIGNNGSETFDGYHEKYIEKMFDLMYSVYYADPEYFYNVHSAENKSRWRELAGIHIEYALPEGKLDPLEAGNFVREYVADVFNIGNIHSPSLWTRASPPDVHITTGGPNAGFTSLSAALDYLQSHPKETVWVMNSIHRT